MPDVNDAFSEAVRLHQAGQDAAAEAAYRKVLTDFGLHAPTLCNLGVLLAKAGKVDEAVKQYHLALAAVPNYADAHFNLGNIHRRASQFGPALEHYRECLKAAPTNASAAYNMGLVCSAVGDMPTAVECFRFVAKREPQNADAHSHFGDALVRSGRLAEGIEAFRRAVELKPNEARNQYNLGLALANADRAAEAAACIQLALKLNPNYAEAQNALGLNLESQGRKDDAMFHYQKAIELKPELSDAWSNLGTNLAEQGRCDDAIKCLRESLDHRPNAPQIHSNLLLLLNYSSEIKPRDVAAEHKAWAEHFGPPPNPLPLPLPHDPKRRLKVGYLSSDFRKHTVSGFIDSVLTHRDRAEVEVFGYANVLRPDEVTEQLKKKTDHWRPIGGLPDEQVFDTISRDQLDVLIDLNGHTAGNRLPLLAMRPAPIQLTLFGYPNTTGLGTVDYRITDELSDPEGLTEEYSTEQLLRLPEVPWCYAAPTDLDLEPGPLPTFARKQFTFGCLNNPAKISEACLATWVKILQTIPGTRLLLLGGQSQAGAKRLLDRITKAGVLRDRVEVLPRLPREKYFETYQSFDLALDPFPYNGGVTTGDALWMGVPVLTVVGGTYVARQGLMVNHVLGLNEFTAASADELPGLAKQWKNRLPELAELRGTLRQRLLASPLGDAQRYVRNLEAALRRVWLAKLEVQIR